MKNYTVYKLTVPDGRVYIGATSMNVKARWNHGGGYRFCNDLWSEIVALGWDAVKKEIIAENLSKDEASDLEQALISAFDSCNPEYGFNKERGGLDSRKIISETTREKIRQANLGANNPNYGKHHSQERIEKIRASNLGLKRSEETKAHISAAKSKRVSQYTKNGEFVASYPSGVVASQITGIGAYGISKACLGQRATAGGYIWQFEQK